MDEASCEDHTGGGDGSTHFTFVASETYRIANVLHVMYCVLMHCTRHELVAQSVNSSIRNISHITMHNKGKFDNNSTRTRKFTFNSYYSISPHER